MLHNISKLFLLLLASIVWGVMTAFANISITFIAENIRIDATSNAPSNSLGLLVADTNNDGFGNFQPGNIDIDDFIDGGDDMVIFRTSPQFSDTTTGFFDTTPVLTFRNGWNEGDPLAFFWLPELTLINTSVLPGDKYGLYAPIAGEESDGSQPWLTPGDLTAGYTLAFLTNDAVEFGTGSNLPSAAFANLLVIPEPQTYALILGGLTVLGLLIVRRRRVSVG